LVPGSEGEEFSAHARPRRRARAARGACGAAVELLGQDAPFLRPNNPTVPPFTVNVLNAEVELPTLARSAAGASGGAGGAGIRPEAGGADDDARRDDD
jgi:hypothetical protein